MEIHCGKFQIIPLETVGGVAHTEIANGWMGGRTDGQMDDRGYNIIQPFGRIIITILMIHVPVIKT